MKKMVGVFAALVALLFVVQLMLPQLAGGLLRSAVTVATGADNVQVTAEKSPPLLMLLGRFDEINVSAQGLQSGRLKFKTVTVKLKNVRADMAEMLIGGKLSVDSMDTAELKAVFSEEDLTALLASSLRDVANPKVVLTPEGAKVTGEISLGGFLHTTVELNGSILEKENKIVFKTGQFNVAQGALGKFGGNLSADIVLADLNKMPIDVTVKNIVLKDGFAEIYADSDHL